MTLIWHEPSEGGHSAFSDQLQVGYVCQRTDGTFWFDATYGVFMKHIAKGSGEVCSIEAGKAAVEKAWATWLQYAGLERADDTTPVLKALKDLVESVREKASEPLEVELEDSLVIAERLIRERTTR